MASTITRRPLPALVSLLALLILTAVVWWRVMNRDDSSSSAAKPTGSSCSTSSGSSTPPTSGAPAKVDVTPSAVTVRVLNSTDRSGIAAKARTSLISAGFKVPSVATNDSPSASITQSAQIRYTAADAAGARLLQYYFPGSTLSTTGATAGVVTVSLGDGYTSVATTAAVKAAMASGAPAAPSGSAASSASC